MRILIHDYGSYPFSAQLARSLGGRGHEVTYLYALGMNTPRGRLENEQTDPSGVSFRGISVGGGYQRRAGIGRLLRERRYGSLLSAEIARVRPDVVLSANCPLDAQGMALAAAHRAGSGFVHWCQDIYSLAVSRLLERRAPFVGRVIGARFARLERRVVRDSDDVVLIAEEFRPIVEGWQASSGRIAVIQNWAPLDEVQPMPKANEWSQRHGVATTPVLLYAGTLGRKHDPTLLVAIAEAVPDALVLVASEGAGTDRLRDATNGPENLRLLPMQPVAELPAMLAAADVLVALLEEDAREFSVPSKVLTYLAAGRPILAAIPAVNAAARTIVDAQAGVVVDPADRIGLAASAGRLLADDELRTRAGLSARRHAERAFEIGPITDRFEAVLSRAANRSHARAGGQARY